MQPIHTLASQLYHNITITMKIFLHRKNSAGAKCSIRFFMLILLGTLCINTSMAQVASYYTFSQSNQTYRSDTSTTSTVPANTFVTGWDDATYTSYKFPFNFTYNGVLYTGGTSTIGVDTDGWIAFSTTGSIAMTGTTAGGSWISASDHTGVYLWGTGNNNGIAGFNSDMEDQTWTTFTANTVSGSQQVTNVTDFSNLRVGTRLVATGVTDGTVITKINTAAATFTMSNAATATGTAVSFTPRTSIMHSPGAWHRIGNSWYNGQGQQGMEQPVMTSVSRSF